MADEPKTLQRREEMLREREREWLQGGNVMLAVIVGDTIAGGCGLHRRRGPSTLELGYWIHPAITRRGPATTVARLLTDAAFSRSDVDCVEIHHEEAVSKLFGEGRARCWRARGTTAVAPASS